MCHNFASRMVSHFVVCLVICAAQGCGNTPAPVASGDAQPASTTPAATTNSIPDATSSGTGQPASTEPAAATAPGAVPALPNIAPPASTESKVVAIDETPRDPATVAEAAQLLDLRTLPVMEGAEFRNDRVEIGHLEYEVKTELRKAIDFHHQQLAERGWQTLPGSRLEDEYPMVYLTQHGYVMQLFGSPSYDPEKKSQGYCSVGIYNYGNTPFSKLPVPASASPHYGMPGHPSYVTTDDTDATREWCRKSLLEAGWQPYGSAADMLYFKRNAIKLSAWVRSHENQPDKTFIDYSSELMSADLPLPSDVDNSQYVDSMARLTFNCANSQFDELLKFYGDSFGERGWKPTTEPIKGDRTTSVVYRNVGGDIILLEMEDYNERSRVSVTQQTTAQLAMEKQRLMDRAKQLATELASTPEQPSGAAVPLDLDIESILKAPARQAHQRRREQGQTVARSTRRVRRCCRAGECDRRSCQRSAGSRWCRSSRNSGPWQADHGRRWRRRRHAVGHRTRVPNRRSEGRQVRRICAAKRREV